MIYIINNNTTHNYSKYSTGPSHIYNAFLNPTFACTFFKSRAKARGKAKVQNIVNSYMFENNQTYLFQTKQLLCWGPDLAFLNLRNTFSNVFKALQICWSAARNNKKILFINGNDSIDADSILVNSWLIQQCKRHSMPRKLNNISNVAAKYRNHLTAPSKYVINPLPNKALFNHLNIFLNSLKIKTTYVQNRKIGNFIKNSNALLHSSLARSKDFYLLKKDSIIERQVDQSQYLTNAKGIKRHKFIKTPRLEIQKLNNIGNHRITTGKTLYNSEKQYVVNNHNQLQIKIKNAIQLQVKEAQTLTQQIAGEITAPLIGFLTNNKTGFNTLQNQLNEEFYNYCKSVNFNNTSKSLFKGIVDVSTKGKNAQSSVIGRKIYYNNYRTFLNLNGIGKSDLKGGLYSQNYIPFSFYIKPVTRFTAPAGQCKAKQLIVRQNIFGNILAWRLKGQHPSSVFYSQFKVFDQRDLYKSKQPTIPNQNNIEAFKIVNQSKLKFSKSQVLFKNTKSFITFKSPKINKASFNFYSNLKSYTVNTNKNRPTDKLSIVDISLRLKKNRFNSNVFVKNTGPNSIDHFYIKRFYFCLHLCPSKGEGQSKRQSVKDSRVAWISNRNNSSIRSSRPSATNLFRNNQTFKAYKNQQLSKRVIPKLFRYHEKKFRNYYDRLINSNQLNQYQMFAKSPFINNKLADIMFFINPEKNQNLVNQANCLKIPTVGVISGIATSQLGRRSCNHYSLNNLVSYPILGNPSSSFFIYSLIGIFIKTLRSS
uniref:Ribosomal protein S2 n=1 Tax=Ulva linza TaxID=63409 RepID=A0A2Z1FCY2_9CHLO|nr:ribosomal protein S2 [Ulva linza]AML80580.1 ribosomal protein S2 [Ulva linza]